MSTDMNTFISDPPGRISFRHPYLFTGGYEFVRALSLVCDLQELYRYLVDDFVIQFCQGLREKDFNVKSESVSRKRKGKREYLNDKETNHMMRDLEKFYKLKVDVPLLRHGKKQKLETLINEEALLLAKFVRGEKRVWAPRFQKIKSDNSNILGDSLEVN